MVAVFGDLDAAHPFHDEEGTSSFSGAGVEDFGDVGMVHHGQRLPFRLEPGDDSLCIHAELDDLERDTTAHRLGLLGDINHAATTLTHLLEHFVAADYPADGFIPGIRQIELDGGRNCRG